MNDIAPSHTPARLAIRGRARVAFESRGGSTRLAGLYHHDPLRVLTPDAGGDPLPHAVLLNSAGGLVGGDRLEVAVEVGAGARALITPQAAEKVYRSTGSDSVVDNRVTVAAGGRLEWLPQETILFDGSRLRRELRLELAGDAMALIGEILVFGRIARGERLTHGLVRDATLPGRRPAAAQGGGTDRRRWRCRCLFFGQCARDSVPDGRATSAAAGLRPCVRGAARRLRPARAPAAHLARLMRAAGGDSREVSSCSSH